MITRIVKMHFKEEKTDEFLRFFETVKEKIRSCDGCHELKLLQGERGIIFTFSRWDSQQKLDDYRHSDLFASTWKKTKRLFQEKAEAWSVDELHSL